MLTEIILISCHEMILFVPSAQICKESFLIKKNSYFINQRWKMEGGDAFEGDLWDCNMCYDETVRKI